VTVLGEERRELLARGEATLVASWAGYAEGAARAALHQIDAGVVVGVFPDGPERTVYNNTLFTSGLAAAERSSAIDLMEQLYLAADVTAFAAWVHEGDEALRHDLDERGYTIDTSTLAMGMYLDDVPAPPPSLTLSTLPWADYLRVFEMPPGLLDGAEREQFHVLVATLDGEPVATAMSYDHEGDCGVFNVTTVAHARRRGLGTAMTALQLHQARERGCVTASLQSTAMAERVYAAAGFHPLGRYLEFVPVHSDDTRSASSDGHRS
jgi:GNAT superfamily N-acetyltransferase